jgi:hypothetical protein
VARKLKVKIPKRVAGMKIPKTVRKGPLRDFLNSSAGQLLLAEGLIVLGSAVAVRRADPDSRVGWFARHPLDSMRDVGRATSRRADWAGETISRESGKLSLAFSEAIRAFRAAMDQAEPADASTTQDAAEIMSGDLQTEPERAKKKQPGSRPETQSTPH